MNADYLQGGVSILQSLYSVPYTNILLPHFSKRTVVIERSVVNFYLHTVITRGA